MSEIYPLFENDLSEEPVFSARQFHSPIDIPPQVVLCFFHDVIDRLVASGHLRVVYQMRSEIGINPVYVTELSGEPVTVFHPGVGAPLAAGFLEEAVALGVRTVVACGGAGALVEDLTLGRVMVVDSALRDEGTSLHYTAPSRTLSVDPIAVEILKNVLDERGTPYFTGRTWTTDGLFRETRSRVNRRIAEGCSMVDMESSAFIAVARFHGLRFGQYLYAGDSLAGDEWDSRHWDQAVDHREALFRTALVAATALHRA